MKKVRALIQIDYNEIISTPKQDDIDRNDENQTSQSPVKMLEKKKLKPNFPSGKCCVQAWAGGVYQRRHGGGRQQHACQQP